MGYEQGGGSGVPQLVYLLQRQLLVHGVAYGEGLVEEQDVRLNVDRDGETQPGAHAA